MSVRSLLLALVTAAALVAGRTPEGFTPGTDTDLVVLYGRVAPPDGAVVDKAGTSKQFTFFFLFFFQNLRRIQYNTCIRPHIYLPIYTFSTCFWLLVTTCLVFFFPFLFLY